jgi:hypothetical protein
MIGNARKDDIIGTDSTEDPAEHYALYYYLAPDNIPNPMPLPVKHYVPAQFCSPTGWP